MMLHFEFVLRRPRAELVEALEDDETLCKLFPGTRIESRAGGVRKTVTPYSALGQTREIRFVFQTLADGDLRFEKVCDGNVWKALDGKIHLEAIDERMTSVRVSMEGRTRAFVPEITIRAPMRDQIDQMARSLKLELERE